MNGMHKKELLSNKISKIRHVAGYREQQIFWAGSTGSHCGIRWTLKIISNLCPTRQPGQDTSTKNVQTSTQEAITRTYTHGERGTPSSAIETFLTATVYQERYCRREGNHSCTSGLMLSCSVREIHSLGRIHNVCQSRWATSIALLSNARRACWKIKQRLHLHSSLSGQS